MSKMLASAILSSMLLILAGCGIAQRNLMLADPAVSCIKTDHQSFLQYLYESYETYHVMIGEVDGAPTAGGAIYCFTPGKHKLGVIGYSRGYDWNTDVEIEIKPRTKYWLRTSPDDRRIFQLIDVTNTPEVMVLEFK